MRVDVQTVLAPSQLANLLNEIAEKRYIHHCSPLSATHRIYLIDVDHFNFETFQIDPTAKKIQFSSNEIKQMNESVRSWFHD